MSVFSSVRERRLWWWTLAVVVAIYSTLGLAAQLAGTLNNHDLSVYGFLAGMALVGATILTQGLRVRPKGVEVGVALGIGVAYYMVFLRMTLPERSHLIEYGVVAAFVYEAICERVANGRTVPVPSLAAVLITAGIGAVDEFVQLFLPSRVFDPEDILFNALAAVMAVAGLALLRWVRQQADPWYEPACEDPDGNRKREADSSAS